MDTYFVGTSKGATTAIAYSLICGGGNVLVGEPQILLGDFIYSPRWQDLEQFRVLGYVMLGRVEPVKGKVTLNNFIPEIVMRYDSRYKGQMIIHTGVKTGYMKKYVGPLLLMAKSAGFEDCISIQQHDINKHHEIVDVFLREVIDLMIKFKL